MKVSDAFPSHYLKAGDLGGKVVPVTISEVKTETVGRERELKLVVYFEGKQKGIVLNKTNANKIVALAGSDDTDDWRGVQVSLYATEVEYQGDTVEAIRIKAPSQQKPAVVRQAAPPAQDLDDSDIPF